MDPVSIQIESFLITVFCGLMLGCLFDGYRVIRCILNPKAIFTDIGDLIFWACSTAAVFAALLWSNWGEVRLYVFVGMMIGLCVYVRFLSRYLTSALLKIWQTGCLLGKWVSGLLYKLVWRPVAWSIQILVWPFAWVYRKPCRRLAAVGRGWAKRYKDIILKSWFNTGNPPEDPKV